MVTPAQSAASLACAAQLYQRVRNVIPPIEWPGFAGDIAAILDLKRDNKAVILAHNYQTPEIFHCVADIVGDSLALAREATKTKAEVIVLAGVQAESDICCTSGNARKVIESLGVERVIMLPDEYLAQNVAAETGVEIITWAGHCEVHERFTAAEIRELREQHPGLVVLAHPECPPEVVAEADFAGSTAAMGNYVADKKPRRVVLVTECSMSDNVAVQHPQIEFVRPCNLCPHMKRITLRKIRRALETMGPEVTVEPDVAARARRAVERMLAI